MIPRLRFTFGLESLSDRWTAVSPITKSEHPMPPTVISVEVHVLDSRHGLWCSRCSLPAATSVELALVHPETLRMFGRWTAWECECGAEELTR